MATIQLKIEIEELPTIYMEETSIGAARKKLRTILKKPGTIQSITRTYKHKMKKEYRERIKELQ
jgi:hypothetical protein|tara:strand:+ start:824 stop:1015 length:192 start_codon:yes stop_codon:yes gene_type:complete